MALISSNGQGSKRGWQSAVPAVVFTLLLAACWEAVTRLWDVPHYIIPRLSDVMMSVVDHPVLLAKHSAVTLGEALIGLAIAVVLGLLAAVVLGNSRLAEKTLYPLLIISQTIPIIAISPIMVMWFGYEIWSKVAVVILFSIFPIVVNTVDGFRSADPEIGRLMWVMGATRRDLFIKWKLPSAVPGFFTGLKMAATISVGGATLGEWLGGEQGLGVYTKRASNMLRGEAVFSGVLLLSLMGMLLFAAAWWLEHAVLSRRYPHLK